MRTPRASNVHLSVPTHEEVTISPIARPSIIITPAMPDMNNNYEQELASGQYRTPINTPGTGGGVQ